MVTAPSLPALILLALTAPPAGADVDTPPPPPDAPGPRLEAAGATPRWDHPLAVRVRLHAPAGDDRPLPPHCLTPTVHYGAWPVPASQLRWRIEHDPDARSAWLALDSPLRVSEPWIDLAVDWHCGATLARQVLTLLVEPDWPGDAATPTALPTRRPSDAARTAEAPGRLLPMSRVVAEDLRVPVPPIDATASPWAEWLDRLARLESAVSRAAGPPPARAVPAASAPSANEPRPARPIESPASPPSAAVAAEPATDRPEATVGPTVPPARVVTVAPDPSAWASPWPWMLASGVLGWAWGRRPRSAPSHAGRGEAAGSAPRGRPAPGRSVVARGTGEAGAPSTGGARWPAWFGAPTRPDTGRWLSGGLARPEPGPVAGALSGSMTRSAETAAPATPRTPSPPAATTWTAPAHDTALPWNQGLLLSEIVHDGVSAAVPPTVMAPDGMAPMDRAAMEGPPTDTAPKETAAKAAVPGSCAA
jgi:hypothetical protein